MSGSEGEGIHIKADMGLSDDCRRVVSETVAAFGGLDIVFNNVGIQPAESYADAVDLPEETWTGSSPSISRAVSNSQVRHSTPAGAEAA